MSEEVSILQKSVIPNLLEENFKPTFMTEISDEDEDSFSERKTLQKNVLTESSSTVPQEEIEIKRRSFTNKSLDYRKTLGKILKFQKEKRYKLKFLSS